MVVAVPLRTLPQECATGIGRSHNGGMRFLIISVPTPMTARGSGLSQDGGRKPCLAKISWAAGERRKAAKASAAAFWREAFGMAHG